MKPYLFAAGILFSLIAAVPAAVLVYEDFDYTAGQNLDDQPAWNKTGVISDEAVIAAGNLGITAFEPPAGNQVRLYTGVSANDGTSKIITYDSGGRASGEALYISFALKVTDVGTLSTANSRFICYYRSSKYNGLAIRQHSDDNTKFDIAVARNPDDTPLDIVWDDNGGAGYSEGDTLLIVYGVDNVASSGSADLKCWINPDPSTFGGTAPSATLSTEPRPATGLDADTFNLGCGNGATVYVDELRFGESYADVTPADSTPRATYFLVD